jgi:hypothetical protein
MNQFKDIFNLSNMSSPLNWMIMTTLLLSLMACAEDFAELESNGPLDAPLRSEENTAGVEGDDSNFERDSGGSVATSVDPEPPPSAGEDEPQMLNTRPSCLEGELEVYEGDQLFCAPPDPENPECFQLDVAGLSCVDRDGDCYWVCDSDVAIGDQYVDLDDTRAHITGSSLSADEVAGGEPPEPERAELPRLCENTTCRVDRPTATERLIAHCRDLTFLEITSNERVMTIIKVSLDELDLEPTFEPIIMDLNDFKPDWVACAGSTYFVASTSQGRILKGSTQEDVLTPIETGEGAIRNLKMNSTSYQPFAQSLSWTQDREEMVRPETSGEARSTAYRWSGINGGEVSTLGTYDGLLEDLVVSEHLTGSIHRIFSSWVSEGHVYYSIIRNVEHPEEGGQLTTDDELIRSHQGPPTELFSNLSWLVWRNLNSLYIFPWLPNGSSSSVQRESIQVYLEGLSQPNIISVYGDSALIYDSHDEEHRWWIFKFNQRSLIAYPVLNGLSPEGVMVGHNWLMWTEMETAETSSIHLHNWMP